MISTFREISEKFKILEQDIRSSNAAFDERLSNLNEDLVQAIMNQEGDLLADAVGVEVRDYEEGPGEGEIPIQSYCRRTMNSILGCWRRAWNCILCPCKAVAKCINKLLSTVATCIIATYKKYKILFKLVEFAAGVFALTLYIKNSVKFINSLFP